MSRARTKILLHRYETPHPLHGAPVWRRQFKCSWWGLCGQPFDGMSVCCAAAHCACSAPNHLGIFCGILACDAINKLAHKYMHNTHTHERPQPPNSLAELSKCAWNGYLYMFWAAQLMVGARASRVAHSVRGGWAATRENELVLKYSELRKTGWMCVCVYVVATWSMSTRFRRTCPVTDQSAKQWAKRGWFECCYECLFYIT